MKKFVLSLLLIFALLTPLTAFAEGTYVSDRAGLLNSESAENLEETARKVSERYGVGIYVVTVPQHSGDIYEACYSLYHKEGLGISQQRNGLILMLSMENREYALFCYGNEAEYAFDKGGLAKLEKKFLDNLERNDWKGGIAEFITECHSYLGQADAGKPVRAFPWLGLAISLAASLSAAIAVCAFYIKSMAGGIKSAAQLEVHSSKGLELTEKIDECSQIMEHESPVHFGNIGDVFDFLFSGSGGSSGGSGGRSRSGGGGHGRSGRF